MAVDAGWKKSKGMMWLLIIVIVMVWGWLLFGRGKGTGVKIPVSFICSECKEITTFDGYPQGFVPFKCGNAACGKDAAWDAYICTNKTCGTDPFPHKILLPKGVTPPKAGEEPSEAFMNAMMRAEETPPTCPKCRSWQMVERYQTEEAKKIIEDLRAKYQKQSK